MDKHQIDQTYSSFEQKWSNNKDLAFNATLAKNSDIYKWIIRRNGFCSGEEFSDYLGNYHRILDAGCGNGRVTALLHSLAPKTSLLVGIDIASSDVATENLKNLDRVNVEKADLLGDLSSLGLFDFIYCQEVLHHTYDPKMAFLNLCKSLVRNGEIAIYVYKKKAPGREYVDDYIRDKVSDLSYDEAISVMKQIANFGKELSDNNLVVDVPGIDVLEIPAGKYDVQRLFYHFFFKCFWNPELSYDENVAINYDWYHPKLCSRHTQDEVEDWFREAGLDVVHSYTDYYGITVRGRKRSAAEL